MRAVAGNTGALWELYQETQEHYGTVAVARTQWTPWMKRGNTMNAKEGNTRAL